MEDPFRKEGREAHREGGDIGDCPYGDGTDGQLGWELGWHEAAAKGKQAEAVIRNEGALAFRHGHNLNPYPFEDDRHFAWILGWREASQLARDVAGKELLDATLSPVGARPDKTITLRNEGGELVDDLGFWAMTAILLRHLGATTVGRDGPLLRAVFPKFALESRIYPTKGVAAVTSSKIRGKNGEALSAIFHLSSVVGERQAFSIEMHRERSGLSGHGLGEVTESALIDVTFGPVPERHGEIDGFELARRYSVALGSILEKPGRSVFATTPKAKALASGEVLELE